MNSIKIENDEDFDIDDIDDELDSDEIDNNPNSSDTDDIDNESNNIKIDKENDNRSATETTNGFSYQRLYLCKLIIDKIKENKMDYKIMEEGYEDIDLYNIQTDKIDVFQIKYYKNNKETISFGSGIMKVIRANSYREHIDKIHIVVSISEGTKHYTDKIKFFENMRKDKKYDIIHKWIALLIYTTIDLSKCNNKNLYKKIEDYDNIELNSKINTEINNLENKLNLQKNKRTVEQQTNNNNNNENNKKITQLQDQIIKIEKDIEGNRSKGKGIIRLQNRCIKNKEEIEKINALIIHDKNKCEKNIKPIQNEIDRIERELKINKFFKDGLLSDNLTANYYSKFIFEKEKGYSEFKADLIKDIKSASRFEKIIGCIEVMSKKFQESNSTIIIALMNFIFTENLLEKNKFYTIEEVIKLIEDTTIDNKTPDDILIITMEYLIKLNKELNNDPNNRNYDVNQDIKTICAIIKKGNLTMSFTEIFLRIFKLGADPNIEFIREITNAYEIDLLKDKKLLSYLLRLQNDEIKGSGHTYQSLEAIENKYNKSNNIKKEDKKDGIKILSQKR